MGYIKLSAFKKQQIGEIMNALVNKCNFELIGLKVLNCKKTLFQG